MKKTLVLILILMVACVTPAFAKPKSHDSGAVKKAGKQITNEIVSAVAGELTGKSTTRTTTVTQSKTKKGLPPGLAKKGKVPPGWEKGKKSGWAKEVTVETKKEPSLIQKWIGALFSSKAN